MAFIDFIEKDWKSKDLDVEKARKWFEEHPTRLDAILAEYSEGVKQAWYNRVFTLTGRSLDMRDRIAEIGQEDAKLAESLEMVWYRFHMETVIGLVKICREDTPSFSAQNFVPQWFHIVLANELDRAFWNWRDHNIGTFLTCSMAPQHAKAQPLDRNVKVPKGWKQIGELKEGDWVDNALGGYSKVNKIFDKGLQPTYRLTFEDGRVTECAEDHLWKVSFGIRNERWLIADTRAIEDFSKYYSVKIPEYCSKGVVYLKNIEKIESKPCRCIAIDSEEHLYVTDDYIVTHNSTIYAGGYLPLILGNAPHTKGILCTYSEDYASTVLRKDFQETIYTDAYRKLFGKMFKRHFNAQEKKKITQQGLPLPVENSDKLGTVQGGIVKGGSLTQITGNPAEFLLVDDPIRDREQANSKAEMDRIRQEFFNSAMSRITSTTLVSVIHTRWTSDDIIGALEKQQASFTEEEKEALPDYYHLCFRARYDPTDQFPYDFRTKKDQGLWDERFKAQYIRIFKGSDVAAQALLQQRPLDDHNSIIKREWLNKIPRDRFPEKYAQIIISVDTSCNDNKDSDKFAIGVYGVTSKAEYYLLDLIYDHLSFEDGLNAIRTLILRYPNYSAILVETKSNGHAVVDVMKKKYTNVIEIDATDSKKSRVHSVVPVLQSNRVYFPDSEQGMEYINQLVNFKGEGKREKDDLVDIMTQTISYCDPLFRDFGEIADIISAPNPNQDKKRETWRKIKGNNGGFERPNKGFKQNFRKILSR